MPAEGVALTDKQALLSADELDVLIQVFVDCGVNKIRFTGGEPTVRKELVDIVRRTDALRSKGTLKTIAMTSNGVALRSKLEELVDAGLDQLNISLDTLDPLRFPLLTRRNGHNLVIQTIDAATKFLERKGDKNLKALKVNCVLMRGINDDELPKFIEMTRERDLEVRFIEYMPFDGNMWSKDKLISYAEMLERSKTAFPGLERAEEIPKDAHGQVSKVWRVPGFKGRVGFITSMTEHFCGTCNRLRLMADGNLKVCLFGASEVNLRDKLRSGKLEEIRSIIEAAVLRKKKSHAGMDEIWNNAKKNRPMITIGG